MRFDMNLKSAMRAASAALAFLGAVAPVVASAQVVWPTVPTTRTRSFNNLNSIAILDVCAGYEADGTQCPIYAQYEGQNVDSIYSVANPYPSKIEVPAAAFVAGSKITDVNVTLKGLNHAFIDDVDVLLVGPGGENIFVLSNAGSAERAPTGAVTWTWKFDDSAALPLPNSADNSGRASTRSTSPLFNVIYPSWNGVWTDTGLRTFLPTDYDGGYEDTLPAPASQGIVSTGLTVVHNTNGIPTITGGQKLSVFNNTSPVGTWSLYVADDFPLFSGTLAGWELEITAKQP
jgi:subtilisin-like proprotein convertase family protein